MNRRRVLAALAGGATAGLGIAGWEVAPHVLPGSGKGKRTASQPSLPKVAPGKVAWRFNANASVSWIAQAGKSKGLVRDCTGYGIEAVSIRLDALKWTAAITDGLKNGTIALP